MRLVFCGTPEFAVPCLQAVLSAGHDVALVVAQPDRPVGRRQVITAPAVKQAALAAGLAIAQPEKLRSNVDFEKMLRDIAPDVNVVVAYGRIIPPWMLELPRHGNLNVHGSLLPKYRGAAPMQWAIANGERETGVTAMLLDQGLDTGPTLATRRVAIGDDETSVKLSPRLAAAGAELLAETLSQMAAGRARAVAQDDSQATLAPILTREDGRVDFTRSTGEIYNRWRGFQPWPGAFAEFRGGRVALLRLQRTGRQSSDSPGTLAPVGAQLFVTCGDQMQMEILELQPAGSRAMPAEEFLRGARLQPGEGLQ